MSGNEERVYRAYEEAQVVRSPERAATRDELRALSAAWKDAQIPSLQRKVVDIQLEHLRAGSVDPVFAPVIDVLRELPLSRFTILDAACASGYYADVIDHAVGPRADYHGSDYSPAMIDEARRIRPGKRFEVQDLTGLTYPDRSFDVVLVSGVLEHVPEFERALDEATRVTSKVLILHRCPLSGGPRHELTRGSQYSIETPRVYFSEELLLCELARRGFEVHRRIELNPSDRQGLRARIRARVKTALLGPPPPRRSTVTFAFRRSA